MSPPPDARTPSEPWFVVAASILERPAWLAVRVPDVACRTSVSASRLAACAVFAFRIQCSIPFRNPLQSHAVTYPLHTPKHVAILAQGFLHSTDDQSSPPRSPSRTLSHRRNERPPLDRTLNRHPTLIAVPNSQSSTSIKHSPTNGSRRPAINRRLSPTQVSLRPCPAPQLAR